jgi:hypothetical protein
MKNTLSLFLLLACLPYATWGATSALIACNQPYALCTTAVCIPAPGINKKSICFCNVFEGISVGTKSCALRKMKKIAQGRIKLTSSFSFENAGVDKVITCPSGNPWTFCLDKPCLIDPRNSNQAICTCDIVTSGKYVTLGGVCDISTCSNTLYSGATFTQLDQGTKILLKALNLTKTPMKFCAPSH